MSNTEKNEFIAVGSACADLTLFVDSMPLAGGDEIVKKTFMSAGGCAFNCAEAVRLCGVKSRLFAPVGKGQFGDFIRSEAEKRGYSDIFISDEENGCCWCIVDSNGERTFLVKRGAEYDITPEMLSGIDMSAAHSLYFCGIDIENPCGDDIIGFAEKYPDTELYFAPGPRISSISEKKISRIAALHPVFHLNDTEAMEFTSAREVRKAAEGIFSMTSNTVIITLGRYGAYLYDKSYHGLIQGFPAEAVDTTGAGDTHIGAYIAMRMLGKTPYDAVRYANFAAAHTVEIMGARADSLPAFGDML